MIFNKKIVWVVKVVMCIWALPFLVSAKIIINEVMYDPSGTDTGREWVEVYNDGGASIDLATLRLFENNVAHTMKAFIVPSALLLPNSYAIVADNPEKFLIDYPSYGGLLVDSAFSLNNTGEPITIQTTDGSVDSSVEYSAEWGAAGTGNSLQLSSGVWIPALPTVATANATVPVDESVDPDSGSSSNSTSTSSTSTSTSSAGSSSSINTTSSHSSQVSISNYKPKITFEVSIGRDRYGFVNTPLQFVADHNQDKTSGMKFLWSTGDGDYIKNKKFDHTYIYEGEYNLILNASYQGRQSVARNKIHIRTPDVVASLITRGELVDIMLENRGQFEVNLGGYEIFVVSGNNIDRFEISPDTIIGPTKSIVIPSEVSRLQMETPLNSLKLLYPNGRVLFESTFNNIIP